MIEDRESVPEEVVRVLACPACRGTVERTEDRQGLRCTACERIYPIVEGIPVMLVGEARGGKGPLDGSARGT